MKKIILVLFLLQGCATKTQEEVIESVVISVGVAAALVLVR